MKLVRKSYFLLLAALMFVLTQPSLIACTACFGKSDSNMAKGMNMGIFALLLVITSVLCGVAGFFVFVAKRTQQLEHEHLPETLAPNRTNA